MLGSLLNMLGELTLHPTRVLYRVQAHPAPVSDLVRHPNRLSL